MRYVLTGLLGAALLFGCGDDDDDKPSTVDSGAKDASTDSGFKDGGGTIDSGTIDSGAKDSGAKDSGPATDASTGTGQATATLESKSGSNTKGTATFTVAAGLVSLELKVTDAEPGLRGVHIHQTGDCSAADATSAGAHWNPDSHVHGSGAPDAGATSHLGDLGNITIGSDRAGTLKISKPEWKLGDGSMADVVGHAVIVHKNTDDLITNASDAGPGMSGARVACGVIKK